MDTEFRKNILFHKDFSELSENEIQIQNPQTKESTGNITFSINMKTVKIMQKYLQKTSIHSQTKYRWKSMQVGKKEMLYTSVINAKIGPNDYGNTQVDFASIRFLRKKTNKLLNY